MKPVPISEAKAHLGRYLAKVKRGERFVITERNRPVAMLVGIEEEQPGQALLVGILQGQFTVPDDFDAPVPEFEKDFYGDED